MESFQEVKETQLKAKRKREDDAFGVRIHKIPISKFRYQMKLQSNFKSNNKIILSHSLSNSISETVH